MPTIDDVYGGWFGARWAELKAAMAAPSWQVGWQWGEPLSHAPSEDPARYYLDYASVLVARALGVQPGDHVLDLCAAPGGKTLLLAERQPASLVANELSSARRARLHRVLDTFLPPDARANVQVTGHDGARWCLHAPDRYDRVLLDAPCSGERHLLSDPTAAKEWTPARSKQLAQRQYALLSSAIRCVKPGGVLVYSTCALSPLEDDGVVERLLERNEGLAALAPLDRSEVPLGEPTGVGWRILPDHAAHPETGAGAGPMYFARLTRVG